MAGWNGKILEVDLTTGKVATSSLPQDIASSFLGGRGLGAYLLWKELAPGTDPLSADNTVVLAVGPLTATRAPTAGRFSLSTMSPLTGAILDCNAGGEFGVRLKRCGYDAVVIRGSASHPVYLEIGEQGAQLHQAASLWGLNTLETTSALGSLYGSGTGCLAIGPAGENLVKYASVAVDGHRFLGRGGAGTVLGAKKLKAVIARGFKAVEVADEKKLAFINYETRKLLGSNPITSQALPEFGTAVLVNIMNEAGALPGRNFQDSSFDKAYDLSGEAITDNILVRRTACWGCTIGCGRRTAIPSGGSGSGPEYESVWALGANCGVGDLEVVAEANYLCNLLGLDTISTGATLACAMELTEKGLLPGDLKFGNGNAVLRLIPQIASRYGHGDELAEGSRWLASKYGAPECAIQVKGLELPAYDPRAMKGQGLGYATSNRGGCHLRGNMLGPEILGSPKMVDRLADRGKAGLLIVQQQSSAALDSLVLCKFTSFAVGDEYYARLLTAVTGMSFEAQDLQLIGERIWNLERLFNLREGFSRADDTLPARLLGEPAAGGPARGQVVDLDPMLEEYYRFRGWDVSGKPTLEKLRQLGLE